MSNFKEQSFPMPVHQNNCRISGFCKKACVRRLCCFIPVCFSVVITPAQQLNDTLNLKEIDSIKKILPALNDTSRIEYEAEISRQYFFKHIDDHGGWLYNLLTYTEDHLPTDVRNMVKSNYFDYDITVVFQYELKEGFVYIIKMKDQSNVKMIRVCDGEMEEINMDKKS